MSGRERGILFSGPMVRALLDGRKTQTRRIVKPQPTLVPDDALHGRKPGAYWWPSHKARTMVDPTEMSALSPYGMRGDRLWVRETWSARVQHWCCYPGAICDCDDVRVEYAADGAVNVFNGETVDEGWLLPKRPDRIPSIFMPRWASRLTLELTAVRVERVQGIGAADLEAEGMCLDEWGEETITNLAMMKAGFRTLWGSINGADSWDANPWVWVLTFRRATP